MFYHKDTSKFAFNFNSIPNLALENQSLFEPTYMFLRLLKMNCNVTYILNCNPPIPFDVLNILY